jgi:hypothetical protein
VDAHPLDNPIWEALHTHHARFASCDRGAARYAAEVAPFAAVGGADPESSAALARLLAPGERLYGVGPAPAASPWLHIEDHGPPAQMVWTAPFPAPSAAMAGERMHAGSWREVSAVCTHPDYLGRGLARGKTLYDRLGFAERSAIPYWLVRRSTASPE